MLFAHRFRLALGLAAVTAVVATCERHPEPGESSLPAGAVDRIVAPIDDRVWAPVPATAHPLARPENELGRLPGETGLHALALHFKRSPAQEVDLLRLLDDQQDPRSPRYHQWITAEQFGDRFGPSGSDLKAVTDWLEQEGFTLQFVSNSRSAVHFQGTAEQVERAFHTSLRRYQIDEQEIYANATDLAVPLALKDVFLSLTGLNNFHVKHRLPAAQPYDTLTSGSSYGIVTADFATIYDLASLWSKSATIDGKGVTIAVIGEAGLNTTTDVTYFQQITGEPAITVTSYLSSTSGSTTFKNESESLEGNIDVEWAGGIAHGATISYVTTGGDSQQTFWDAMEYVAENQQTVGNPLVMTVSYGQCEANINSTEAATYEGYVQTANAEGITVVAAAGDSGAAGCDTHGSSSTLAAQNGEYVSLPASIPEVTGVGGTEFNEGGAYTTYWSNNNASNLSSAKSYIPEKGWNDTTDGGANAGLAASGGGVSGYFNKPSWQTGTGVPDGGHRYVPDLAFSASSTHDAYMGCYTDVTSSVDYCTKSAYASTTNKTVLHGGTSVSSPSFAGVVAMLVQATGGSGLGNINSTLYSLAAAHSSVFHDITSGNNIVPCAAGKPSCPGSSPFQFGYSAGTGYDEVTGWGSVDVANLWTYWPTVTAVSTPTASPAQIAPGETVVFTAPITTTRMGPTMTGTVKFYDGTTLLGSGTITGTTSGTTGIVSASATYSATSLTAGTHSITAVYSGDSTYLTSTSAALSYAVTAVSISPSTTEVIAGGKQVFTATGGTGSYTWSISSNKTGGSVTPTSGSSTTYTGGTTKATDTITVKDSANTTATASATVVSAVSVTPTTAAVVNGGQATLTMGGGSGSGYTCSITTNVSGGSVSYASKTCTYTAGTVPTGNSASDVVTITDSAGTLTPTATVTVYNPVTVSPAAGTTTEGAKTTFMASGGVGSPYTWTIKTNNSMGSIVSTTGVYTAGTKAGIDTIQALDSASTFSGTTTITVNAALALSPTTASTTPFGGLTFTATQGVPPYTWTVSPNNSGGTVGTTGVYKVGSTGSATDTVKVTDSAGTSKTATVTVGAGVGITGASFAQAGGAIAFKATGGSGSYTWSISPNNSGGSIVASTGAYIAGSTTGVTDTIQAQDTNGDTATASVVVYPGIVISPTNASVGVSGTTTFSASGGTGSGYAWSITSTPAHGAIVGSTGVYTAGATSGVSDTVQVKDSAGIAATTTVSISAAMKLTATSSTTAPQGSLTFTLTGGTGSYSCSLTTKGSGSPTVSVSGSTATYKAGTTGNSTDVVACQDTASGTASQSVTVTAGVSISGSATMTPPQGSLTFTLAGGSGTYSSCTVTTKSSGSPTVSVSGSTVSYKAGSTGGVIDQFSCVDSLGNSVSQSVTVAASVTITPKTTATTTPLGSLSFTIAGGLAPYSCSVSPSGSGNAVVSVNGSTASYTAGATGSSTDTIKCTDSLNISVTQSVTITAGVGITPNTVSAVIVGGSLGFTLGGGTGTGFACSVSQNNSQGAQVSVTGNALSYVAGSLGGTSDTVKCTDSLQNAGTVTITVRSKVTISPASPTPAAGAQVTFTASGGTGTGYVWTLTTNNSSASLTTDASGHGVYTAGTTSGVTDVVTATDPASESGSVSVPVKPALAITPSNRAEMALRPITFTASGGTGSGYVWTMVTNSSGGFFNCAPAVTCTYSAGSVSGNSDTVQVADSAGNKSTLTLLVTPALTSTPSPATIVTGGSVAFKAAGGSGGYTWSLSQNASGATLDGTGNYTAGAVVGAMDTVSVTDSAGYSTLATVTVVARVTVSPSVAYVNTGGQVTFSATGGSGTGYKWVLSQNNSSGSINSSGVYTAGSALGVTDTVQATDSLGNVGFATVNVAAALAIAPSNPPAQSGVTLVFAATGGSGSYAWSISTNRSGGTIGTDAGGHGDYQAGGTTGVTDVVQVKDSAGNTATVNVTVYPAIAIQGAATVVIAGTELLLSATGGSGKGYVWSFGTNASKGTLSTSGDYIAGNTTSVTDTLVVTDSAGNIATIVIAVKPPVAITPVNPTVYAGKQLAFSATGGGGTYTWSLLRNTSGATINSAGLYTAGNTLYATDTVEAKDAIGNLATTKVLVDPALFITPATTSVPVGGQLTLTPNGGSGVSYTWKITTNNSQGSISNAGVYTAGAIANVTDTVTLSDSGGSTATATINVFPAVSIAGATSTPPMGHITFVASGGTGSTYTWSIPTNNSNGTITSGGVYTAGTLGFVTDTVEATDTAGISATVRVSVGAPISVSPYVASTPPRGSVSFTAKGGSGTGFVWVLTTNNSQGSVSSAGVYTAGSTSNVDDLLQVTDSLGNVATVTIVITAGVVPSPLAPSVAPQGSVSFSASGGSGTGYKWTMSSAPSSGTITSAGVYIAGKTGGVMDIATVTDSLMASTTVPITVTAGVSILGAGPASPGTVFNLSATGGSGTGYQWSFPGNNSHGSLSGSGVYTAGSTVGVFDTIQVIDSLNNGGTVQISVMASLVLSPPSASVAPGGSISFIASGGSGGYTWTLISDQSKGTLTGAGVYTAGTTPSVTDTVQVQDTSGNTTTANISVTAGVSIAPMAPRTPPRGIISFMAMGGSGSGYVWSLKTPASGSLTPGGVYTAGAAPNQTDTVHVVDSLGNGATTTITVTGGVNVTPAAPSVAPMATISFVATGGSGTGFQWTLTSAPSGGSITTAGAYVAGTTSGLDVAQVTDSLGNTAVVDITVGAGVVISGAMSTPPMGAVDLAATGGSGTGYRWSLTASPSGGSISSTGVYTAGPNGGGTDSVQVKDSLGNIATATIQVTAGVTATPDSASVTPRGTQSFSASGGSGTGFKWTLLPASLSGGSITPDGDYTAGPVGGVVDIAQVSDSLGNTAQVTITVTAGVTILPASPMVPPMGSLTLSANGGTGTGYSWQLRSAPSGGHLTADGVYTAGSIGSQLDTAQVTDSLGNVATATIDVTAGLTSSPASATVAPMGSLTLSASGGSGTGYTWALSALPSGGTITPDGFYVAGTIGQVTDIAMLSDSLGNTTTVSLKVTADVSITPGSAMVAPLGSVSFMVSGGSGHGYVWSLTSTSGGRITAAGVYTAGATPSVTDTVQVVDSVGGSATAQIQVTSGVLIAPVSPTTPPMGSLNLSASGGSGSGYTWTLVSAPSGGNITAGGLYTAGARGFVKDAAQVKDSLGNVAMTTISVTSGVLINPGSTTVTVLAQVTFRASGGSGTGYTWTLVESPSGGMLSDQGVYTAGPSANVTDQVQVTDSLGNGAMAEITVKPVMAMDAGMQMQGMDAGTPDSGTMPVDAGSMDAGMTTLDVGGVDAGTPADAGSSAADAGATVDAGSPPVDAGTPPAHGTGGCACGAGETNLDPALVLAALAAVLRRRRAKRTP